MQFSQIGSLPIELIIQCLCSMYLTLLYDVHVGIYTYMYKICVILVLKVNLAWYIYQARLTF